MDDVADSYNVTRNIISRFCDYFSTAPCHCACKMGSTYRGIKFESAVWRLEEKKLKICQHLLTSCTLMKNRSCEVVEKGENGWKCTKMKNARVKRAKLLFVIVKYANSWRSRRDRLTSLLPVDKVRRKHVGRRVDTQTCILDLVSQPCKFNRLVLSDLRQWKQNSRPRLTDSNIATPSAPMFPLGVTPRPPIKPAHKSLERKTLGFSHTPSTRAVYLFWGDILSCTGKRRLFTHKILGRAVCKWTSKVITRFRSVRFDVSFKISRQFFIQREAKPKPNATCTRDLSRPLSKSQVIASISDWFIALFAPVVIGRSNYFATGFSTVICKPF